MNNFDNLLGNSLNHLKEGEVLHACNYALNNGGKRVRPALLFSVIKAYNEDFNKGVNAAIAIEMIHTYSLIHDDLPAMDDSELRRGKPCVHKAYGEDIAILAGDTLLTEAFYYANKASDDLTINSKVIEEIVSASGANGMIHGQELDVLNIGDEDIDIDVLNKINLYKTAKMIILSLKLGAILTKHFDDVDKWENIGEKLGLIFQIQDDLLDITSSEEKLGKTVNIDEDNNKTTYALKLGEARCKEIIDELYQACLDELNSLNIDTTPVLKVFEAIIKRER